MLLAVFKFVANLLALESLNQTDFCRSHEFFFFLQGIINLIAKHFFRFSAATAFFHSWLLTLHAVIIVTNFDALMFTAREETFTESITCGYWVCARFALFT